MDSQRASEEARDDELTRRRLLGGAAAAGLTAAVPGLAASRAEAQLAPALGAASEANVVVVVIDSLRTDHVGAYGGRRARTPTLDALAAESLVFTHARLDAMPTVPVRKSLLIGRSGFPFRGWRPGGGLPKVPGFEGIGRGETTFLDVLGRRGYRHRQPAPAAARVRRLPRPARRGHARQGSDPGLAPAPPADLAGPPAPSPRARAARRRPRPRARAPRLQRAEPQGA
jgi:hypothetical protein